VVAEVRSTTPEAVAAMTTANFQQLFRAQVRGARVDSPGGLC
jgi:hypothetical protein